MKFSGLSQLLVVIAITQFADGSTIGTRKHPQGSKLPEPIYVRDPVAAAKGEFSKRALSVIKPRSTEAYQEHFQYPSPEFKNIKGNDDDFSTKRPNSFGRVWQMVQAGLTEFNNTRRYCTTWFQHDEKEDVDNYSQSSIWCKDSYSVELWNAHKATDSLPARNVRVFCYDAMLIAEDTLQSVHERTATVLMDPADAGRYEGQRWITGSNWSEDMSWGVDITYHKNGCPDGDDKAKTATVSYEGKPAKRDERDKWDDVS
ncbi:hypothetical protein ABW20_dc0102098 [Dactylellina cionopaga]|nr:hypothetical protein ABW20_dc0102098 [Dactylellina cionopaga]